MTLALIALMVAVALEAAVIAGLALRLRALAGGQQQDTPTRFEWDEPMPWDEPETTINGRERKG
jgi:hypothetical protein